MMATSLTLLKGKTNKIAAEIIPSASNIIVSNVSDAEEIPG